MIVRQSFAPITVGIIAGIAVTIGSGPLLQHLFQAAKRPDLQICIVASIFLLAISLIAAWLATTRILAIDPINAIRAE
jgi:ABC-type antimicrobial peptide transport system permease subunit